MDQETAKKLRERFPASAVGKLPKGKTLLDYVGHAAVTDRLLAIDPEWNWEPLATDEVGLPAIDRAGNLWIRLTIAGVTRIGCGDGETMKVRIGDAIRNAAMRFGVALDLWSKEELESGHVEPQQPAQGQPEAPQDDLPHVAAKIRRRAARILKTEDVEAVNQYIFAALQARGLSRDSAADLQQLIDEWEAAS